MTAEPLTAAPTVKEEGVSRAAWGLLWFLTALNVLNFVDRMLIASLAPLLIADLGLTRAQIGLLSGFGFVFFYTFVGIFLGMAADRYRRLPLIGAGLALWSAMTALSGWARSFIQLAIPRIFVGVGEATLTPAAISMLADAFPTRRLGFAIGVYYAGIPIGVAVAMVSSSIIAPRYGWRFSFFVLGAIGVLVTALLAFVREPLRKRIAEKSQISLRGLLRDLFGALRERRALLLALVGGSLLCYGSGAALLIVTWLVEERGVPYANAAFRAGIVGVLAGFIGNVSGGMFGDACAKRFAGGRLWSLVVMTAFFAIPAWLFYTIRPEGALFYICWFFTAAGTTAWFGSLFSAFQELAPAQVRSTIVAFALLVLNLLGVGPGPLVTGMIGDARSLTSGLLLSIGITVLAVIPFALAARSEAARTRAATGSTTPAAA